MNILTIDIGGANTKTLLLLLRSNNIKEEIFYFPLWKKKNEFENLLEKIKNRYKPEIVGITTTAELCDVFETKKDGIRFISKICKKVFGNPYFLTIDGKLTAKGEANIGAANYVASIYYLERKFREGILIDIGSTTTDIIPFRKNEILYGKSDLERLAKLQLIYTGMLRTPLNTIVHEVIFKGKNIRVASEFFAITADLYRILGYICKEDYSCETPDGKGRSLEECMRRVARLLCSEVNEIEEELPEICEYIKNEQIKIIAEGIKEVVKESKIKKAYICGVGSKIGIEACKRVKLAYRTLNINNLPCLGLAYMLQDIKQGG